MDEVVKNSYVLMPGKYVGTEEEATDGILFGDKMQTLTVTLAEQFAKRKELEKTIRKNITSIGYEI
jgi:type I restriction enzyme M protein